MASKEKVNVIHRSNRGRNGVDVKTKTDSGCFVDDELEKQTQGEKSPTTKTDNIRITKTGTQDTNIIPFESSKRKSRSVRESDPNSVPHNVEGGEEMSQMNGRSEDTGIQDDFQSDLDFKSSVENTEPREDFYCLYYSDSPNGSLTRSKEKSSYVSSAQDGEDIGAKAEELLKKLKEDALKKSPNATSEVPDFQFRQGPSVTPKPKRTTKQQSGYAGNGRDPILAELEMLGPAVGRDFTSVETDENDESLLSNAVKELNLAQTTDECLDKFDAIQTALIENIPDTLERTKAKSKKDVPKRRNSSEANKAEMPSDFKMTEEKENSPDAKKKSNGKKGESPKPSKKKFEPIKFSRTEVQSLNSMKKDSHHKRSHLNADNAKPVPTKSETYRLNKPDTSKRISERSESSKINLKKDTKVSSPQAGKPSPKKPNVSVGSKDVAKKRERLELRSSRRRRSGDLTSIPENAVMDDKNEKRISDEVVPLAKEEDVSSDEDDEDLNEAVGDENDFPSQNPTGEKNAKRQPYLSSSSSEDVIRLSSSGTRLNVSTNYTLAEGSPASAFTRKNVIYDSSTLSSRLRREDKNVSYSKHTHLYKQPGRLYDCRGRDQHLSDGGTSESTAGYSSECSANDADDETENFQVYGDPEDIVEMTFGSQIDEQPEGDDNYVFADESTEQLERDNFVEARDLASMYLHSEATQDEFEDIDFALQGVHHVQGGDASAIYEYFEEPEDELYHNTPEHSNSVSRYDDVEPKVPRQGARGNTSEEHIHSAVSQKPKKFQKEEGPDPSGFMTVQDIKRLIFQGTKPSMPRSTSFCGIPSSAALRKAQEQDTFQRKSWSGYGVRQQQEPGIDPLVRNFPQNSHSSQRLPKGKVNQSPYVRTVNRRSTPQVGYYSDTQLNAVNEGEIGYVERSGSFRRSPLQRRSHSLETYHSDNSIPDGVTSQSLVRRPARANVLIRSASDCSSNYSQGRANGQFQRKIKSPNSNASPRSPYINAEELAELVSSRASYTTGRGNVTSPKQQQYSNSHYPQYTIPQSQRNSASTFPRHSSESLRIQALRQASQRSSDNESDVHVSDGLPGKSNLDAMETSREKTLSERFTEVPQRISFEELVEKLDLGSDSDSEDEVDYRIIIEKPESECGADLEFDNGDYFDDKNMIVGEAMRLKKVLGSFTEQDPELETLVSATTDPKLPDPPQAVYDQSSSGTAHKQPSEALIFESPPPYREVGRKSSETSDSSSVTLVYDVPALYESETESHAERTKMEEKLMVDLRDERKEYPQVPARRDSETQTNGEQTEKAISAEELLKILLNASQGNLQQVSQPPPQADSHELVQNLCFPKPQTKAASTGNIHSEEKFPGHVSQLYGNSDLHSTRSSLGQRRHEPKRPTCHKSQECIRNKDRMGRRYGVLQAKMIGLEDHKKKQSKRIFEEEVDCMKTKNAFDFSSGEISTSGSSIDDLVDKKDRVTNVSFVGCEETKEIETLPRVKFSTQRKRKKSKTGYLSDQDIPTAVKNGNNRDVRCEKSSENLDGESTKHSTTQASKENGSQDAESEKESFKNDKAYSANQDFQRINLEQNGPEVIDLKYYNNGRESYESILNESPHDSLPSPNSVNVFIDYNKKNVMKITTSTPKIHHAKLVTQTPHGISPVPSDTGGQRTSPHENGSSFGEEEFPPSYETSPPGDRSSSVYSSDDDKFFGSSDTVVFVDKTAENSSVKPNVDDTTLAVQDQGASTSDDTARADEYSARVDSLFQEVRSSLDLDSIGSDLLDQAMERVKDRLSPRSSQDQGRGSITMEAFVALHQADELQAIINEIKGELWILQQENTFLKEKVVSLQHGEACSSSECTEDSLTESAERIDSIRRQIAAVVANKQRASESEDELITVDVFLRGFGSAAGLKRSKKTDVKLGTVKVKGGTDWSGVYDAAKTTFLEHVKHIDPCSCLGLGPTSMYGAQIGATMLTPETLRRKNPRVEISRKFNSCVIQLKDGMTESFDTLIYDTLIPKSVLETFVRQILENRFIVLCGAAGLGKTFLATKLAEHLAQRFGSKNESPVLTLEVGQTSRKELKKTLAHLMKCDISSPSNGVPVVVILDQLDCLASLADIFDPKQLEGNRNSPFIIGVRNKSKKGPFSSKDLAVYKYFRWIQMSVHDHHVLGLLERFLRRKLSWTDNVEDEEDLLDLFLWLTQVWQRLNQILQSYVDIDVTIGPSVFYSCPMDMHAAEGWFANVWNYTIIPYLHQNLRNSNKIYERNVPWECPTKWVIMRWPWNRERSKVLATLKKLRQVDIVLNRNSMESAKGNSKGSHSKTRKSPSSKVPKNLSPSKVGSLESWSTADWDSLSVTSEVESIASSTL